MSLEMIITNNNLPLLQQLDPLLKVSLARTMGEFGEELQKGAVEAIQNQMPPGDTPWTELSEWWVEFKKAKGFSDQIYIMSSTYIQAITWKLEVTEDDMQTVVGVMRNSGMDNSGRTEIWMIAEILEYGWEQFKVKIPPRPLWRPLLESKRRSMQTRIGTTIFWSMKKIQAQAQGEVEL